MGDFPTFSHIWAIMIQIQGKPIAVTVDTGAEVTAILDSTCTWRSLNVATPLEDTEVSLYGLYQNILGKTNLSLTYHGRYILCTRCACH